MLSTNRSPLVLASASPRRLDLLAQVGVLVDEVDPANIDEKTLVGETARRAVLRLSVLKAATATVRHPSAFVIGADTIVSIGGRMLGKPRNEVDAEAMLVSLSGRGHRVITGVTVIAPDGRTASRLAEARVRMKRLSDADRARLMDNGEWRGAAGGYRIQGLAAAHVVSLTGSYTAIVGLPLSETLGLLTGLGWLWP